MDVQAHGYSPLKDDFKQKLAYQQALLQDDHGEAKKPASVEARSPPKHAKLLVLVCKRRQEATLDEHRSRIGEPAHMLQSLPLNKVSAAVYDLRTDDGHCRIGTLQIAKAVYLFSAYKPSYVHTSTKYVR